MPRYEIRRTSDSALTYVEGTLPVDLMKSQAAGTYRAKVMSAEEATDIVVPTLTASIVEASLDVGDTATLTTNAPDNATYQWELDGTPIGGATASSYVTAAEGALTCVVSIPGNPQAPVETAAVTVAAAAGWVVDESFAGLASGAALTTLSGYARVGAGTGQIRGDGAGNVWVFGAASGDPRLEYVRYTGGTFAANQIIEIDVILNTNANTHTWGVIANHSASNDGYLLEYFKGGAIGSLSIRKLVAGVATTIGASVSGDLTAPFTMRLERTLVGSDVVLECFIDGVSIFSRTDTSAIFSETACGLFGFANTSLEASNRFKLSGWRAQ